MYRIFKKASQNLNRFVPERSDLNFCKSTKNSKKLNNNLNSFVLERIRSRTKRFKSSRSRTERFNFFEIHRNFNFATSYVHSDFARFTPSGPPPKFPSIPPSKGPRIQRSESKGSAGPTGQSKGPNVQPSKNPRLPGPKNPKVQGSGGLAGPGRTGPRQTFWFFCGAPAPREDKGKKRKGNELNISVFSLSIIRHLNIQLYDAWFSTVFGNSPTSHCFCSFENWILVFFFWSESRRCVFPAFARRGIFIFTFRAKREDFFSYFSREARRKISNLGTAASKAINV